MIKKGLSVIILLLLLLSCGSGNGNHCNDATLIAHGGGAIDGYLITNSLEALHSARDNGYRYIELDLCYTSDSAIVAVHDWLEYNRAMGLEAKGDSAPTLSFFMSQRLPSGHTPLSAEQINEFFLSHDSLHLVTDKISDPDILERFFPALKQRMVVEAFCYEDYCELIRRGFEYVSYSCLARDIPQATLKHILFAPFFDGERIERLALHTSAFGYVYMQLLLAVSDYEISLYTVNGYDEIPDDALEGLKFVYTDSLLP